MKTDSQIQQDVIAELKWEPSINAAEVGVEVKNGVVTLAGHVASYGEKWDAERAAQRVAGVKALAVEIDVALGGTSKRNDADIARSVENVLEWTSFLSKDPIKVMVENGWVTLSGEVLWDYQRQAAKLAVRYLMGVTGVSDQITIRNRVTSTNVKTDIEAALKRRASNEAQQITVAVTGDVVTLTGNVHNWAERDLVTRSAWCTPGVSNVVDNIKVTY